MKKSNTLFNDFGQITKTELAHFQLSKFKIDPPAKKTRQFEESESRSILEIFNKKILAHHELPDDKSFSFVLSALKKLELWNEAEQIFSHMEKSVNLKIKMKVIGPWSYTALLQIYRYQIENANIKDSDLILQKARGLLDQYQQAGHKIDSYIVLEIMTIYRYAGKHQEATDTFCFYQNKILLDLPTYSEYITALIELDKIDEALNELDAVKIVYQQLKVQRQQDLVAMRCIYSKLIGAYMDRYHSEEKALDIFKDAINIGLFANNLLQLREGKLTLDFHFDKDFKKKEGGVSIAVAKITLTHFVNQVNENGIHDDAEIVTGGHFEEQSKLKQQLPVYLNQKYGIDVIPNENSKIATFKIPYISLRKMEFIHDLSLIVATQRNEADIKESAELAEVIRRFQADMRLANEGIPNKHFSEIPIIPKEFSNEAKKIAQASIDCFVKNNSESERLRKKLIELMPNHPWPYVHLGWVLHRMGKYDDAIDSYQRAIQILEQNNFNDSVLLSDAYRKQGLAHYRKYFISGSLTDFNNANKCYEQAANYNAQNFEIYNNWGTLLERAGQYQKAIEKFLIIKENNPKHDESCVHLGNCYKTLRNYKTAQGFYLEAIDRVKDINDGKPAAWAYYELGDLYYLLYRSNRTNINYFNSALQAFELCLKLQPTRDQAYRGLGKLYKIHGDNEKSQEYFAKAENCRPTMSTEVKNNNNNNDMNNSNIKQCNM